MILEKVESSTVISDSNSVLDNRTIAAGHRDAAMANFFDALAGLVRAATEQIANYKGGR